jgi:hypothetical protein
MDTRIEYLQQLETDLEAVARAEAAGARPAGTGAADRAVRRGRGGRADQGRWLRYVGAAAAALTLAWGVGFVAQGGLGGLGGAFSSSDEAMPAMAGATASATGAVEAPRELAGDEALLGPTVVDAGYATGDTFAPVTEAEEAAPAPATQGDGGALGDTGMAKIVRDGSVALTIPEDTFEARFQRLFQIAAANGGFVLSSETRGASAGSVVLRIPAERFDEAIVQVRSLGTVSASQINGQDVTAEYIDLEARLEILQARRDALLTILAQADGIGEILAVQNRVDQVQLEIEKIQGRLRYLDDQVEESTLRVDMRERLADEEQRLERDDDVENPSLGRAWDLAVQGAMNVLATVIVGIGYLVPLGLLAVAGWGAVRLVRRRDRGAS